MKARAQDNRRRTAIFIVIFLIVNLLGILFVGLRTSSSMNQRLEAEAKATSGEFEAILDNYKHSFQLFTQMMAQEIQHNPDPDQIWKYLKGIDSKMLDIEGETFDGLYMYYKDRYLYSWDTPYAEYERTGYAATERPWYKDAIAGKGDIVFTPPYMSYANHYILTTISQLQPDGKTVFAYDIKMGDIQNLISSQNHYHKEEVMAFDSKGTVVGSTNTDYLGSNFYHSEDEAKQALSEAKKELERTDQNDAEEVAKAKEKVKSAEAFYRFRQSLGKSAETLVSSSGKKVAVTIDGAKYYGYLQKESDFSFLILVPFWSMLKATVSVWLVPLLILELLLVYFLGRVSKELKNRELRNAYIELGQTQKRLEVALDVAKKAAAIDDLTGTMNFKSFKKEIASMLESMEEDERGILIMIDGDHFKQINDTYGHNVGDEVIKLSAQMIIGRIRTIDIASRLHGDEFAIFVSNTSDYSVARKIMEDINKSIKKEAERRKLPSITLSAGAVIAKHGDTYTELSKTADEALYQAKETHNGGFSAAI